MKKNARNPLLNQIVFVSIIIFLFFSYPSRSEQMTHKYTVDELINYLDLKGHVEGGFYRRTYEASETKRIMTEAGERFSMTSIYYLLSVESPIGHFHLNKSDIVHYFQLGDPITYYLIDSTGELKTVVMGTNLAAGERLQLTVPGGVWKASKINENATYGYSLISEAVSPGFNYIDMTLGDQESLLKKFPQHKDIIEELSHTPPPL